MHEVDPTAAGVAPALLDAVADAILVIDESLQLTYMNRATRAVLGLGDESQASGDDPLGAVHPDDRDHTVAQLLRLFTGELEQVTTLFRVRHPEGKHGYKPVEANASRHLDDPMIRGVVVTFRDFETIVESQQVVTSLTQTLNMAYDFVVVHSGDGRVLYANEQTRIRLGWQPELPEEQWPYDGSLATALMADALPAMAQSGAWNGEITIPIDGTPSLISLSAVGRPSTPVPGEPPNVIILLGRRSRQPEHPTVLGLVDPATRSADRAGIDEAIADWRVRNAGNVAVVFAELSGLRHYTENPGLISPENLLWLVSNRLRREAGTTDLIVQVGSESFAVLSVVDDTPAQRERVNELVSRLSRSLSAAFTLPDGDLLVRPRFGVQVSADEALSDALRQARVACDALRDEGSVLGAKWYDPAVEEALQQRRASERLVRSIVANGDVFVLFQPIVELDTRKIVAVEALARAHHEGQVLAPDQFIGAAQRLSLISEIDSIVLMKAAQAVGEWGAPWLRLAVNVSADQLLRPDLPDLIVQTLQSSGLSPDQLVIELTESNLYLDIDAATEALRQITELGVRIALDDFGTGYSSLTHLAVFRVDSVKIDRSFMKPGASRTLVNAIVQMAGSLGLETVAEGVEREEDVGFLTEIGCTRGQGYLFSRPVSAEAIAEMLTTSAAT